jgi:hypothetical protein
MISMSNAVAIAWWNMALACASEMSRACWPGESWVWMVNWSRPFTAAMKQRLS